MRSVRKYVLVFEVMCMYRPKFRAIHFPLYDVSVEPEKHLLYMIAVWWNNVEVRAGLA